MPDQTIKVQISPLGAGGVGGAGTTLSAEDFLTYDSDTATVGAKDGNAENDVIVWEGSSWARRALKSEDVTYDNPAYPNLTTVKQAVGQILFQDAGFRYVRLEGQGTIVLELGDEINTAIQLGWDINKPQDSLDSLSASGNGVDGDFSGIDKSSSSPVNISLNSPITATSIGQDSVQMTFQETRPDGSTNQRSASAQIDHRARVWWGNAASDSPDETLVKGLQNSELRNGRPGSKTVDGGGNYIYFAWPKSMGDASKFVVGGFEATFVRSTVSVTNSFGVTKDYYVYRSLNTTSGSNLGVSIQ